MTGAVRVALCTIAVSIVAACGDSQAPPVAKLSPIPDSAEQILFNAEMMLTDQGIRRAVVKADTMLMYDENTREELRTVIARFYSVAGEQEAVLNSRQGSHNSRLGTMEARGDVVVVSKDGKQLNSPHLKYDPSRNEISSDSAFTLTEGERITKGIGFVSSPDMRNMRILKGAQLTGADVRVPRR